MVNKAVVLAVSNQKGGTGKTTTCENLGIGLAQEGKKVLLVDTDPQASLTVALGYPRPDDLSFTLSDAMEKIMTEQPLAPGEGLLHHPEGVDLIPVQAQYLSAKGLEQLLQTINKVRRQINPKLKIEGILLTMVDSRTNYAKEISALIREAYGSNIKVFSTDIPRSVRAAEISAEGRSIFEHDPKGKVAEAYRVLTKDVLSDAEKRRKRQLEQIR